MKRIRIKVATTENDFLTTGLGEKNVTSEPGVIDHIQELSCMYVHEIFNVMHAAVSGQSL